MLNSKLRVNKFVRVCLKCTVEKKNGVNGATLSLRGTSHVLVLLTYF